eukprot:1889674-Prymnesium_polylepis.1
MHALVEQPGRAETGEREAWAVSMPFHGSGSLQLHSLAERIGLLGRSEAHSFPGWPPDERLRTVHLAA